MNSHFNFLAPFYDRVIPFARLEQTLKALDMPHAGSLLDAGGGTGRVAEALRSYIDSVIVADVSRGMLAQARQKNLAATSAETERLPFPDESFDRILMVDALHHVVHQGETVRELYRVLKQGGRLVIEEPDLRTFVVKLIAVAEKLALMRSHFLAPDQIAALLPSGAQARVESEDHTAWVIAEKEMRTRSAAILIQNNSLALIERHRGGLHYFAFPGGGVDEGETPEQAAVREAREELGVEIRVLRLAAKVWFRGNPQFFFLAEQVGGEFGSGSGEEYASDLDPARGSYEPVWMPLAEVSANNVLPAEVAALVVKSHPEAWSAEPLTFAEER